MIKGVLFFLKLFAEIIEAGIAPRLVRLSVDYFVQYEKMPQWKQYLKAFIKYSLEGSPDKLSFIENMRRHGYDVKWEDGHKYVTFTTPEGYKCRDNKLFDDRYLRCNMEIYFAIRNYEKTVKKRRDELKKGNGYLRGR